MESLLQDFRFAVRQLIKQPAFTVVALVTLALGIGANTAIFSVVYGVLIRPLPYPEPERIVGLQSTYQGASDEMGVWYRQFTFLRDRGAGVFEHVAAATSVGMNLAIDNGAEHLHALRVSRDYFHTFGVAPALGRDFAADEDQLHGPAVMILSHDLWMRRFGGDPGVIGRTVRVDGQPTTVIGVMPAGFQVLPAADAWSTLAQVSTTIGSGENLELIGRLRRDLPLAQANARMAVAFADFRREFTANAVPADLAMALVPYTAVVARNVRGPIAILFGAIGFVLLIACANVASLLLGRTAGRRRELAVRLALGASRVRIARQIVTESLLLAVTGAVLAVGVATWGLRALIPFVPDSVPRAGDLQIDGWALLFTAAIAIVTGLGFGLVPALQVVRRDPGSALAEGGTRTTGSAEQGRVRNVLIAAEVALAIVLLSGAGLMIRTFTNLLHTDAGFDPRHELAAEIWLTGSRYDSAGAISVFYQRLSARLNAVPGVASSAVVEAGLPLERGGNMAASVEGGRYLGNDYRTVTPGYFATLGVRVEQGRDFTDIDDAGATKVAVVSASFAHRFMDDHALGRTLTIGGDKVPRLVVGVVGDTRSYVGYEPQPTVFLPSAQTAAEVTRIFNGWFPIHVIVRARGKPEALVTPLREAIAAIDPSVPIGAVRPLTSVLGDSLALQRFLVMLLSAFAGLAVVLAMVGIYGLISWFVVRHTREIGVRMALGARPGAVMFQVIRRGMTLAAIGGVAGVAGAVLLTRFLSSLLYDVKPGDPLTLVAVTALLLVVAAAACIVPARRAAQVDPIIAMRTE